MGDPVNKRLHIREENKVKRSNPCWRKNKNVNKKKKEEEGVAPHTTGRKTSKSCGCGRVSILRHGCDDLFNKTTRSQDYGFNRHATKHSDSEKLVKDILERVGHP